MRRLYLTLAADTDSHDPSELPQLTALLATTVSTATWAARRRALRLLPSGPTWLHRVDALLAQRQHVLPATRGRDLAQLKFWVARLQPDAAVTVAPLLQDAQRALRHLDAARPRTKALPISPDEITQAVAAAGGTTPTALLLLLAWRTASRLSDIMQLPQTAVRRTAEGNILVMFSVTKARRAAQDRTDHQVVVTDPGPLLRLVHKTPSTRALFPDSCRRAALRVLRAVAPQNRAALEEAQANHRLRHTFTANSVKRGAAAQLWLAAANKNIPVASVATMLKHKDLATSVGYAPAPTDVAKAMGTDVASAVLTLPRRR